MNVQLWTREVHLLCVCFHFYVFYLNLVLKKTVNWFLTPNIFLNVCTEEVQSAVSSLYFYLFLLKKGCNLWEVTCSLPVFTAGITVNYQITFFSWHHSCVSTKTARKFCMPAQGCRGFMGNSNLVSVSRLSGVKWVTGN